MSEPVLSVWECRECHKRFPHETVLGKPDNCPSCNCSEVVMTPRYIRLVFEFDTANGGTAQVWEGQPNGLPSSWITNALEQWLFSFRLQSQAQLMKMQGAGKGIILPPGMR